MTLDPTGRPRATGSRAARRAEQRRRQQRRKKHGAGVITVLVVIALFVVLSGPGGGDKGPTEPVRTQRTVLFQVAGSGGTAVASALLAHDPKVGEGAVVLVPPQVIAAVPGSGTQFFGRALLTAGVDGSRNALADLLGVTVDHSLVLDVQAFARLVDGMGGIEVDVDVPVLSGRTVVLQAGQQRLDGKRALAYGTYLAPGEQEQSRLARLQSVVDGIIGAMPKEPAALLGSLGAGARLNGSARDVSAVLSGLANDAAQGNVQYRSLPVIRIDTGTDAIRLRIDTSAVRGLADDLFADSVPEGVRAEGNRVLVLNGVGTPGLGAKVREKLVRNGLVFVGSRNAPSFGYTKTLVLVGEATTEAADIGARVAKALGVPGSSVQVSNQIGSIADVVVIVGKDFKP